MNKDNKLGMNKTGIAMSPMDSKEMIQGALELTKAPPGTDQEIAENRQRYMADSKGIGTVPPPASVKGVLQTGMQMLTGADPVAFMNKIGERIAFERAGVRLYDALISKFEFEQNDFDEDISLVDLQRIRNEEYEHFLMLNEVMESLGGDPTVQTPSAAVVGVMSMGLQKVAVDPKIGFKDTLEAILVAELADNDSWDMLVQLAEEAKQEEIATRFRHALDQEHEHLAIVRTWMDALHLGRKDEQARESA